jgi:hypothetical protein
MSGSPTVLVPPETPGMPQSPPGRARRGLRIALVAVAAVLVLALSVVSFALRDPSPWLGAVNPSVTPSPIVIDGRVSPIDLRGATLDVPAWPADNLTCRAGRLTFVGGKFSPSADDPDRRTVTIPATAHGDGMPAYGDVDRDGLPETVVLIMCGDRPGSGQLVALDRDATGQIVTMGTVVAMTNDIRDIDSTMVRIRDDATIEVGVGDYQKPFGSSASVIWQTRGYGWDAGAFRQVSGPTEFPDNPNVTETSMTAEDLVFGPVVDGMRHGTLKVTVTYLRGATPDHLSLTLSGVAALVREGSNWPPVRGVLSYQFTIDLPSPAVGGSVTYAFAFGRPAGATEDRLSLSVRARTAEDQGDVNVWSDAGLLPEANGFNNTATVAMRETN